MCNDGGTTTAGNNVDAFIDRNDDGIADVDGRPISLTRQFYFTANLFQDPTLGDTPKAAVVNAFYWANWMHDKLYDLGFTESQGNFQTDNFGRGGTTGDDGIRIRVQSGLNGGQIQRTRDGTNTWLKLNIFSCPTPRREGAFDATVIAHEYTHGLVFRRAGLGSGINQIESQGLDEGWADFLSLALLAPANTSQQVTEANYPYAAYCFYGWRGDQCNQALPLSENYYFGIRRFPYSTNLKKSPLTLIDLDTAKCINQRTAHSTPIDVSPFNKNQYDNAQDPITPDGFDPTAAKEYHNMGEIWCVTLWDARANLINKYLAQGYDYANQAILRIVAEGMKYYTPYGGNPTYLQARDGLLMADQNIGGGVNKEELWAAFYKRGMGPQASVATDTEQGQLIHVLDEFNRADFDLNGHPDILFEAADTSLQAWSMNNITRSGTPVSFNPGSLGGSWWVVGTADINQDGRMDFFLEDNHSNSSYPHNLAYRYLNGSTVTATGSLNPDVQANPKWHIVGSGDFHRETQAGVSYRDTQPDLLWQHDDGPLGIWWMNGPNCYSTALLNPNFVSDPKWKIVGTGDFNHDGKTDIVWQYANPGGLDDGIVAIWLMDGITLVLPVRINAYTDPHWRIVGTGDFNGDKNVDLLFQYKASPYGGILAVWYMNGTDFGSAALLSPSDPGAVNVVGPN